jgi:hypothetical protein
MQRTCFRIGILAVLAASALLACHAPPPPRAQASPASIVYVDRRSWHIAIGFAAGDLLPPLAQVRAQFPAAAYLEFGFGDRRYYEHHGTGTLLAALWPGDGLILMTALKGTPAEAFGAANVLQLPVTARQSRAIQSFIWRSLSGGQRAIEPLAPGPYEGSEFYAAIPKYSGLYTCNTWAAQSLQSAGLPIRSRAVVFAGQLWSQARHTVETNPTYTAR